MRRFFKSVVQVRANERTAALVALYTLFDGNPLLPTMGRIQDDRGAIRQQRQRLLHRKQEAFDIDVEDRVIELFGDLAEGGILRNTSIREENIELALLPFDLCEEAIKIAQVRDVSLDGRSHFFQSL